MSNFRFSLRTFCQQHIWCIISLQDWLVIINATWHGMETGVQSRSRGGAQRNYLMNQHVQYWHHILPTCVCALLFILNEMITCWKLWRAGLCGHKKASPPPKRSRLTSPYCSGSEDLKDTWPEKLDVFLIIIKTKTNGVYNLASLAILDTFLFLIYFFLSLNTRWRYMLSPFSHIY